MWHDTSYEFCVSIGNCGSFNPCSIGFGIQTKRLSESFRGYRSVSILVLLDLGFRHSIPNRISFASYSFNPCSIGFGIQTIYQWYVPFFDCYVSILVLLDLGFRPLERKNRWSSWYGFQSLFYWIWDSDIPANVSGTKYLIKFQSLFYWIWDSDNSESIGICLIHKRFQSLFYWIWDSDQIFHLFPEILIGVSILVLLDLGFRHLPWMMCPPSLSCFNPCSIGFGIQTLNSRY